MVGDIRSPKALLNLETIGRGILWRSALSGWFFMLRISELLKTNNKTMSEGRLPNRTRDIDPLGNGRRSLWENHVDEISVRIAGPKTDWVNHG